MRSPKGSGHPARTANAAMRVRLVMAAIQEGLGGRSIGRAPEDPPPDVLLFLPPAYLNLHTARGMISDKAETLIRELERAGQSVMCVMAPARPVGAAPAAFPVYLTSYELLKDRVYARGGSLAGTMWDRILDRLSPRLVAGITIPDELCKAARRNGIPAVEIQHSLIGSWYLELLRSREPDGRPTHFLAWEQVYAHMLQAEGVRAIATGYPMLKGRPGGIKQDQTVLVSLQYRFPESTDPYGMISKELDDAIQAMQEQIPGLHWRFRVHPVFEMVHATDPRAVQEWLQREYPGSEISWPSRNYVFDDVVDSSLVITHHSSTTYEAALAGVPSIVVSPGFRMDAGGGEVWDEEAVRRVSGFHMTLDEELIASGLIRSSSPTEAPAVAAELLAGHFAPYRPRVDCDLASALTIFEGQTL